MTSDAQLRCLVCGHALNITESNPTGIGLIYFERQKLECPNCGGHDSRFTFVLAKAGGSSTIGHPASTGSDVKPQVAEFPFAPPPLQEFKFAEPKSVASLDSPSVELQPVEAPTLEPQSVNPRNVEKAAPPAKTLTDLIQRYRSKWRRPI